MTPPLDALLADARERVDERLDQELPPADQPPTVLHEAMRYAVFSGGKRLRPALAFGAEQALAPELGAASASVTAVAAAVELVHTYSLVHDDLPAMDDDAERRGQATVHVKFGEANAILVGDALLAEAFATLARADAPALVVREFAEAASSRGLVGGQVDDLAFQAGEADVDSIASVHARKTSRLFRFATGGAAHVLAAAESEVESLEEFAGAYGMAFQLADDLADAQSAECSMLAVMDAEALAKRAREELDRARQALAGFEDGARFLRLLCDHLGRKLD